MKIRQCIKLSVESNDSSLLDNLEGELPGEDDNGVAEEYSKSRVSLESGGERLSARVTYEDIDQGKTAKAQAQSLYGALKGYPLPDDATLSRYRTPVGGHSPGDVEQYYENNPGEKPTDEDGNKITPSSWRPSDHMEEEF
ncbi:MAG: hypothetical protein ABEK59_01455 [Halobacteria archaeon]